MGLRAVAQPLPRQWGTYRLSADQTAGLAVNNPIRFDAVTGGTLGISAYTILLPAGRVFRLMSSVSFGFSASGGSAQTAWFDTGSALFLGTRSQHLPPTNTTTASEQPVGHAIVSTAGGTVSVQLRIAAAASVNRVFSAFAFAEIMEIA